MKKEDEFQRERGYWVNGQIRNETPLVNGQLQEIETWWHDNGHKWIERSWVNGMLQGISTWWHDDGSLRGITKWNQGQEVVWFGFNKSEVPEGKVPEIDILRNEFKLL
jgi:antitoxin component YwqK of YwqJK toxin-antitoxin module